MATKKIWGAGGTIPQSDWAQTDPSQMDYIHNKPENIASTEYVDNKLAEMLDSAPETLDTLNELAAALGDDPNFAATVAKEIGKKSTVTVGGEIVPTFDADTKNPLLKNTLGYARVPMILGDGSGTVSTTWLVRDATLGGVFSVGADQAIATYSVDTTQRNIGTGDNNRVLSTGTPKLARHAANKEYVDTALATKMSIGSNYPTYGVIPLITKTGTSAEYLYWDVSLGSLTAAPSGRAVPTYTADTSEKNIGAQNRVLTTGTPKLPKHCANKEYVDAAVTALGAPITSELTETTIALTLACNTEYHCVNPIESLSIEGFEAGVAGISEQWSIIFTTASTISVTHPSTIKWAVAEPIFEANKTYWLSFIPFGNNYLGVWTVMA